MLWALGGIVAVTVVYGLAWQWGLLSWGIVSTGTVQARDGKVLETRAFYRSSRKQTHKSPAPGPLEKALVWEVKLPSGRWVECDGADCRAAYEKTLN
jgi:hypothetical protein